MKTKTTDELKKEIEAKVRANVIREMRTKHPKGFCYVCGKMSATNHHLRDDKMGRMKRGHVNGVIPLCRECHDAIEEMKKYRKLKKAKLSGIQQERKRCKEIIERSEYIHPKVRNKVKQELEEK
jgi:hypothetical protein